MNDISTRKPTVRTTATTEMPARPANAGRTAAPKGTEGVRPDPGAARGGARLLGLTPPQMPTRSEVARTNREVWQGLATKVGNFRQAAASLGARLGIMPQRAVGAPPRR